MKEIEAKVKLNDLSIVEKAGLIKKKELHVFDIYYENDLTLSKGLALRLRNKDDKCIFGFKGPVEKHEDLIVRDEIETGISNFEDGQKMLESIGFAVNAKVEKIRTYYEFSGSGLKITIDNYPFVGLYIEVEGEEKEVYDFINKFDLKETIQKNCTELFLDYVKEKKLVFDRPEVHFTFEDEKNIN